MRKLGATHARGGARRVYVVSRLIDGVHTERRRLGVIYEERPGEETTPRRADDRERHEKERRSCDHQQVIVRI